MKRLLWILLLIPLVYPASKLLRKTADQFILSEIQNSRANDPRFDTRPLTEAESREVGKALSQKYTYFGCGGQAYVFFSDDDRYVIKFFKQRHFREPTHLNYIPFIKSYRDLKFAKRQKRILQEYTSYKTGFEHFPDETALLYLHLNKTTHLNKKLVIIDKMHLEHEIDLDTTDFILQRKAELVHDNIRRQMAEGKRQGAEQTISSLVNLIVYRCQQGYCDKDPNIATNCGIFEGRAIKIDVGRFYPDPRMKKPLFFKPELYHLTRPFRQWLVQNQPELVSYLDQEVFKVIAHE